MKMKLWKNKRGDNILVENVIFLVLNVLFFVILIVFLMRQGQGLVLNEEILAKQIALLIDNAKPNTNIRIDFSKSVKIAEKKNFDLNKVVSIDGNLVRVKLSEDSGYSYSFFNDVEAGAYFDPENKNILVIVLR